MATASGAARRGVTARVDRTDGPDMRKPVRLMRADRLSPVGDTGFEPVTSSV